MYCKICLFISFTFLLSTFEAVGAAGDLIGSYYYSGYSSSKSPVSIDEAGNIYSTGGQFLFAMAPDGTSKWIRDAEGMGTYIRHPAVVGPNGTIYFGTGSSGTNHYTQDGLYAFDSDGKRKWIFDKGGDVRYAPAVAPDGTIYVVTYDHGEDFAIPALYAVNPDGTEKLQHAVGADFKSGPGIDHEGNILVVFDSALHSIAPDFKPNWSVNLSNDYLNGPLSISDEGDVYAAIGEALYAYSREGGLKWSYTTESSITPPAIDPDGNVYFVSGKKAYALDGYGNLKWIYETTNNILNTPAIGADGTVIFTGTDYSLNKIYALNADGTLKWDIYTFDRLGAPVIGKNGILLVTANENVHAYQTDTGGAAASGWPMIGQNIKHTSASPGVSTSRPPSTPLLSATTDGLNVYISWNSVPTAEGYTFSFAPSPYRGPHTITSLEMGQETSLTAKLWPGARYFVVVEAINEHGSSGYSDIFEVVID